MWYVFYLNNLIDENSMTSDTTSTQKPAAPATITTRTAMTTTKATTKICFNTGVAIQTVYGFHFCPTFQKGILFLNFIKPQRVLYLVKCR